MAGSRVSLAAEPDAQAHLWSLTSQGFLCYTPTRNLVLDIKGDRPSLKKALGYLAALRRLNTEQLLIRRFYFQSCSLLTPCGQNGASVLICNKGLNALFLCRGPSL